LSAGSLPNGIFLDITQTDRDTSISGNATDIPGTFSFDVEVDDLYLRSNTSSYSVDLLNPVPFSIDPNTQVLDEIIGGSPFTKVINTLLHPSYITPYGGSISW